MHNVRFCLDFPNIPRHHGKVTPDAGTRIKRARERRRWSQRQLADALHVDRKTVDNWENGRTQPRSRQGAIEEVLGIGLDEAEPEPDVTAELLRRLRAVIRETVPDAKRAAVVEDVVEAALRGEGLDSVRRRAPG